MAVIAFIRLQASGVGARHAQFEIGEHLFPDGLLAECAGGAYVVVKLAIFFWRYEDK
jgi:hypothetical protein